MVSCLFQKILNSLCTVSLITKYLNSGSFAITHSNHYPVGLLILIRECNNSEIGSNNNLVYFGSQDSVSLQDSPLHYFNRVPERLTLQSINLVGSSPSYHMDQNHKQPRMVHTLLDYSLKELNGMKRITLLMQNQ